VDKERVRRHGADAARPYGLDTQHDPWRASALTRRGRKTIKKRMVQLQAIKMELRKRIHDPIAKSGAWMEQMLKGHLNYYAVSGNDPSLWWLSPSSVGAG
jgi:hypothetical protein